MQISAGKEGSAAREASRLNKTSYVLILIFRQLVCGLVAIPLKQFMLWS